MEVIVKMLKKGEKVRGEGGGDVYKEWKLLWKGKKVSGGGGGGSG